MAKIETDIDVMALYMKLSEYRSRYEAVKRYVESTEYASKETILAILGIKEGDRQENEKEQR